MIYIMIIGASIFSYFMSVAHAPERMIEAVSALNLSGPVVVLILLIIYLILGAIFDEVAAIVVTLPFVLPLIKHFGYDLVWWGIINVTIVEIALAVPTDRPERVRRPRHEERYSLEDNLCRHCAVSLAPICSPRPAGLFPSLVLYTIHLLK